MGKHQSQPAPIVIQAPAPLPVPAPAPLPAVTPALSQADAQALYNESLGIANNELYAPGGVLDTMTGNAAQRGITFSGILPEQESQVLQETQANLANISTAPSLTAAMSAQSTLQQGLSSQMQALQSMAGSFSGSNQLVQESNSNPYNFGPLLGNVLGNTFPGGIIGSNPANNMGGMGGSDTNYGNVAANTQNSGGYFGTPSPYQYIV